jgi:REP element-mobilizing transposase RayT
MPDVFRDRPLRRNSLRYPGYDYSQAGAVFMTICTHNRQPLFGSMVDGQLVHSPAGDLAVACWESVSTRYDGVEIDAFVVMPDHLHAILFTGIDSSHDAHRDTVGFVVRGFKAQVVAGYRRGVNRDGWTPYEQHLWQRDYHDRIIRSDAELEAFRTYIAGNPGRWCDWQESAR